jgi:hypothetical protein
MQAGTEAKTEEKKCIFCISGWCPLCEQDTEFRAVRDDPLPEEWFPHWFRSDLKCVKCHSIPRQRALFVVLQMLYPKWRDLQIHESSPSPHGASERIAAECRSYTASQYDENIAFGSMHPSGAYRSEDLECQTFASNCFDLVITQDVFEHLFSPDKAIREIARTLRPGGAHIMTVPLVRGNQNSIRRADIRNGKKMFLLEPQYHGNPMSPEGSLVTIDWGYDIIDFLWWHSGLLISMFSFDDLSRGLRSACQEVLACRKPAAPVSL